MFEGSIIYYTHYPDFIFTDIMTPLGINLAGYSSSDIDNEIFAVNNETRFIFSYYADKEEIFKEAERGSFELSSLHGNTLRLVVSGENINNPFGTFPYGNMPPPIPLGAIDITLPANGIPAGVSLPETEENVPVKYYNLMGTEVKNPEPGNILIKVRGNDRMKILSE